MSYLFGAVENQAD